MAFDRARPALLTLRLAGGSALVGALAFLLIALLTRTHFYATALIVAGAGALAVASLARAVQDGTRAASDAWGQVRESSARSHGEHDELRALLDTVPAALLVLEPDGGATPANRAAYILAGADARRLEDIAALGAEAGRLIRALPPGGRAVVAAAGGRRFYASASQITRPGRRPARLIALQSLSGDLDAVEQQAWGDLIRVLAHEMMNSLTPIASLSESLSRRPDADAETQAALQVIARRSANLMAFVDRYRAMAELPRPIPRPVDLAAFAADIQRLMTAPLEVSAPAGLIVMADPALLEQAVINLVKNALDATADELSPRIALSVRAGEGRVLIAVADNGEGVPPDRAEAIFVPFFTSRAGGSGIGLSLARQIALAHGGQLTVRSQTPRGSVFELSLPAG
jgi:two-component system nitrogen regulation sensor histidine kinase NtrY